MASVGHYVLRYWDKADPDTLVVLGRFTQLAEAMKAYEFLEQLFSPGTLRVVAVTRITTNRSPR